MEETELRASAVALRVVAVTSFAQLRLPQQPLGNFHGEGASGGTVGRFARAKPTRVFQSIPANRFPIIRNKFSRCNFECGE